MLLLFAVSCQPQEDAIVQPSQQVEEMKATMYTALKDEKSLSSVLPRLSQRLMLRSSTTSDSILSALELNTERILKTLQADSSSYIYSIGMKHDVRQGKKFQNLVLKEVPGGFLAVIVEYDPDNIFSAQSNHFSGTIRRYDLDGKLLKTLKIKNGEQELQSSGANNLRTAVCVEYAGDSWECIPNGNPTESPAEGEGLGGCTYTYFWEFNEVACPEDNDGGGGDGGWTGGGDPDYGGGTYIPEDPGYGGPTGGGGPTSDPGYNGDGSYGDDHQQDVNDNIGVVEPRDVILDPSFSDNEKLNCIYSKLIQEETLSGATKNFMGENSHYDLIWKGGVLDGRTLGATYPPAYPYTDPIVILIDIVKADGRPTLMVAKTLLHEAIHAQLTGWAQSVDYTLSPNNFPGLFDYYSRFGSEHGDHQLMAAHYIETLATGLAAYDNDNHSKNFYEAIAWEGLIGTVTWNSKTESERNSILEIINNFIKTGNKQCE